MDNNDFAVGYAVGDNAANRNCGYGNGMFGGEMGFFWVFALLLLPMMMNGGGFWGNNRGGNPVDEAGLCNSMNFNNLQNAVGRLNDTVQQNARATDNAVCQLGYQSLQNTSALQRDLCTSIATLSSQIASCCCDVGNQVQQNRYEAAMNTAAINSNTTATGQKVLDAICSLRMEMKDDRIAQMQGQINQLQLNAALCGVVRYPNQTAYYAQNPFFNCGCNTGCGCGNNI